MEFKQSQMRYLCCKQGNFINRTKGEHESLTVETLKPGEEIFFAHLPLLHVKGCASGTPCIYYTSLLSACLHRSPLLHFCFLCIDFLPQKFVRFYLLIFTKFLQTKILCLEFLERWKRWQQKRVDWKYHCTSKLSFAVYTSFFKGRR